MISEKLVRSCLYNWLGYGNLNSRIWFIGTEEGGYEIWRANTKTLEESLALRSKFELSEDLQDIWENKYGIQLNSISKTSTWTFISAFLLGINNALDEREAQSKDTISNRAECFFRKDKMLGRAGSDHFMCELLPLPKKNKHNISPYSLIWNMQSYWDEVLTKRLDLISDTISNNQRVELIVSYESILSKKINEKFKGVLLNKWEYKGHKRYEKYSLHDINIGHDRNIILLSTPFFGQGWASYKGVIEAARKIKAYKKY